MMMQNKILTGNILKIISIAAMFVDHTSTWLVPKGTILDIILHIFGRLAAPIMCYFIAEGFFYTSNIKKYILRLLVFAALSHFPYVIFFGITWWKATGVIWGLAMGLIALAACKNPKLAIWKKLLIVVLCCILAYNANWNYIAVLWIVFFGIFRGQFKKQMLSFAGIGIFLYIIPGIIDYGWTSVYRIGILLTIPLFALYSGKRGKKSNIIRWGFYVFYPLHLIVLSIFKYIVFG